MFAIRHVSVAFQDANHQIGHRFNVVFIRAWFDMRISDPAVIGQESVSSVCAQSQGAHQVFGAFVDPASSYRNNANSYSSRLFDQLLQFLLIRNRAMWWRI